ncbi:neutral protease 2-like protein [Cucurbitaria berberidis CBS 394.84]|uniref:Neutral protease 2 n=1 Tax=Cucurbitaria berberidis CBS 394.84 TaxID=1168544 RepID=A0A9P4GC02_9PLEO|nr:neutral protease 2-like protein [Cucurbitaria berberidis CBS 394.84]KAF1842637.1 neutral protease 2-like protein [Cucurbitaria berberidis CBS 394.84]
MKVQVLSFAALASLATAFSDVLSKRDSPLSVALEVTGNTNVKAVITNKGSEDLKLFKTGTFLDDSQVQKVEVFQSGKEVAFDGIRLRVSTANLDESAFHILAAGQSIEAAFDIAVAHDLSAGGNFDLVTEGAFAYAELDSTVIAGAVPFTSNTVSAAVNGEKAAKIRRDYIELAKRTVVQSDCTGTRRSATTTAISNCASLARAASAAAANNPAKLNEYFKSTSAATVATVQRVFNNVASQCGSTTSGNSRYYCTDVLGACSNGVLAYTSPSTSQMVNCPLFFTALPAQSRTCHAQDQATTVLHETTHLTQVKGTSDYGGYGYNFVRSLSSAQNLNHADTYALFAQALFAGC